MGEHLPSSCLIPRNGPTRDPDRDLSRPFERVHPRHLRTVRIIIAKFSLTMSSMVSESTNQDAPHSQNQEFKRALCRLDRFLTEAFLSVQEETSLLYFRQVSIDSQDGSISLHTISRTESHDTAAPEEVFSKRSRDAFLSHNCCTLAAPLLAPFIAFIILGE